MRGLIRWCAGVLVIVLAGGMLAASANAALPRSVRVGSAAVLPRGARAVSPLPAAKELQLTVALKSQDPGGLESYATEVSMPASPSFRHYLTVAQFAQRFGATPAQIVSVRSALQAQGLSVGPTAANALTLPVHGTAAQVEKAFSIALSQVKLASGRTAYANIQAPSLPTTAAQSVQAVIGLDNVSLDQPALRISRRVASKARKLRDAGVRTKSTGEVAAGAVAAHAEPGRQVQIATGGPQPCEEAQKLQAYTVFGTGLTADQIAAAYQLSDLYKAGSLGDGQTVALFEEEAFRPADIAAFQACYGTSAMVTPINVDGGPEPYKGEDAEAALDIEQIIGLAPHAHVLVYQGPIEQNVAPVEIISRIVSDDTAKVISSSYGECEALTVPNVLTAENALLQEAAAQGQSFFAASGDSGSEQCSQVEPTDESLSVENPASQPFATGVGGTALYSAEGLKKIYTGALPPAEGVWNDGPREEGGGGTGGGVSAKWGMPSYQSSAASALGVINAESSSTPCGLAGLCREVPDVAANADLLTGYVVYVDGDKPGGGWMAIGGTSAAAPLWAAFTALVNSSPACRGVPVGFVNPSLYSIASSAYASNFRDIVEPNPFTGFANNDARSGKGPFPVSSGYDMTTGLGTPLGSNLAASLCAIASPVFSVSLANPGAQTNTVSQPIMLQITGNNSAGTPLTYTATGLPTGLSISPSGLISGTPTTPGTSTVTIAARDAYANTSSTAFAWTVVAPPVLKAQAKVVKPPTISRVSLSGISRHKPNLRFTISTDETAPAFTTITVTLARGLMFSTSRKSLLKGVVVNGASLKHVKLTAKAHGSLLTITLAQPTRTAQLSFSAPAIGSTRGLTASIQHHKVRSLSLGVAVTDISHTTTQLSLKSKAS